MKKILLTLLTFVAISIGAIAQDAQMENGASFILDENGDLVESTSPVFEFEKESHDFGELPEGPKAEVEFKFTNTGKEPLIISRVKASCGCTTPEWPEDPILPGEESVIKAVYNTKNRPGPFTKSITIYSNAYTPTKRLMIKGTVKKAEAEQTSPVKSKKTIVEQED